MNKHASDTGFVPPKPVRKSTSLVILSLPIICGLSPLVGGLTDLPAERLFDCNHLIPKLTKYLTLFSRSDICAANAKLWFYYYFLLACYGVGFILILCLNPDCRTRERFRRVPKIIWDWQIVKSLLLLVLMFPGFTTVMLLYYVYNDVHIRRLGIGGPATSYPTLDIYADRQIDILMLAANLWMWLSFILLTAVFTRRPMTEAEIARLKPAAPITM